MIHVQIFMYNVHVIDGSNDYRYYAMNYKSYCKVLLHLTDLAGANLEGAVMTRTPSSLEFAKIKCYLT